MKIGEVLRFTSIQNRPQPDLAMTYKAERGQQFVGVLLGVEPRDASDDLDLEAAMNRLGWVKAPEPAEVSE